MRLVAVLAVASLLVPVRSSAEGTSKSSVAMLGVTGGAGFDPKLLGTVEELLLSALAGTGRFTVTGQSDIARLIGFERQKQMLGCGDNACIAELAGSLGVSYIAAADLGKLGTRSVLTVKLINVATAAVVARITRAVPDESMLVELADAIAAEIASVVPAARPAPGTPAPVATQRTPAPSSPLPAAGVADASPAAPTAAGPIAAAADLAVTVRDPPAGPTPETPAPAHADVVAGPAAPPSPAEPSVATTTTAPGPAAARPRFAARAGLSPLLGVLGIGAEWRPHPRVGVSLGTGTHALGGGLSLLSTLADGGFYVDVHALLVRSYLVALRTTGTAAGVTAGWDWRLVPWLSIKTGVGLALLVPAAGGGTLGLAYDLAVGPVF
jgi:hypothetical protein